MPDYSGSSKSYSSVSESMSGSGSGSTPSNSGSGSTPSGSGSGPSGSYTPSGSGSTPGSGSGSGSTPGNSSSSSGGDNGCGGNKCWLKFRIIWCCQYNPTTGEKWEGWCENGMEADYACRNANPWPEFGTENWAFEDTTYNEEGDWQLTDCSWVWVRQLTSDFTSIPMCVIEQDGIEWGCQCYFDNYPERPEGPPDDCSCGESSDSGSGSGSGSGPTPSQSGSGSETYCDSWLSFYDCNEASFSEPILADASIPCNSVPWPSAQGSWEIEPEVTGEGGVCAYRILLPAGSSAPSAPTNASECGCSSSSSSASSSSSGGESSSSSGGESSSSSGEDDSSSSSGGDASSSSSSESSSSSSSESSSSSGDDSSSSSGNDSSSSSGSSSSGGEPAPCSCPEGLATTYFLEYDVFQYQCDPEDPSVSTGETFWMHVATPIDSTIFGGPSGCLWCDEWFSICLTLNNFGGQCYWRITDANYPITCTRDTGASPEGGGWTAPPFELGYCGGFVMRNVTVS